MLDAFLAGVGAPQYLHDSVPSFLPPTMIGDQVSSNPEQPEMDSVGVGLTFAICRIGGNERLGRNVFGKHWILNLPSAEAVHTFGKPYVDLLKR
jgi:hypothetical protein